MRYLPKTKLGKWGAALILLWPLLTILGSTMATGLYAGVEAGNRLVDDLHARPVLAVVMLTGLASGVISFACSALAIFRHKERSVLVFVAAMIGLFLITLLVG